MGLRRLYHWNINRNDTMKNLNQFINQVDEMREAQKLVHRHRENGGHVNNPLLKKLTDCERLVDRSLKRHRDSQLEAVGS